MNGDCSSPNASLVNRRISIWFGSLSLIQWNLGVPRSSTLILLWGNAFWRSPHTAIGLNIVLISTLHSKFWRAGPVSKQSFNEKLLLVSLADASYTIHNFVLSAFSKFPYFVLSAFRVYFFSDPFDHSFCKLFLYNLVLHQIVFDLFANFSTKLLNLAKLPDLFSQCAEAILPN